MNIRVPKFKIASFLYWFIGLNTAFHLFRNQYKIFMFLYIGAILCLLIRNTYLMILTRKYAFGPVWIKLVAYLLSSMCAVFYGMDFFRNNLRSSMQVLLILICLLKRPTKEEFDSFMNGFKISVSVDIAFGVVEFLIYLIRRVNINAYLFAITGYTDGVRPDYLHLWRISGFDWDPFIMGMFCLIMFFISEKGWKKFICLVILIASGSRAAIVGFAGAIFFVYRDIFKKRKYSIAIMISLVAAAIILPDIMTRGQEWNIHSSGYKRVEFITMLPEVVSSKNIIQQMFGGTSGYSGASFYYSGINCLTNSIQSDPLWAVENDWQGIIYGNGWFGLFAYLYFVYRYIKKQKNKNMKAIMIGVFFAGVGYFYDRAIYVNMILILSTYSFTSPPDLVSRWDAISNTKAGNNDEDNGCGFNLSNRKGRMRN